MKKIMISLALIMLSSVSWAQTLEECQQAAEKNYPLIKQYGLIAKTTQLTVKNIQKGWLPQVTASAQATYQSAVTAWPESMQTMYQQMGLNMKGLRKDQYKIGVDLQQTIYDGGAISSQRNIAQQEGKVQEAQTETNLYQVRRRVNEMYFSLLLLNEQIQLNEDVKALLQSSEKKLSAMVKGGTAATSDLDNVRAERLSVEQQNENLKQQKLMLQRMLSVFCGLEVNDTQKPAPIQIASSVNNRPEMRLYNSQLELTEAKEKALDTQLRPKLGLFAQGFYDKARLSAQREMIENAREVFLFNNKLEEIQQSENISRYQTMMKSDDEIIVLRTNVRKAAESKLTHGIIDVISLLREINNENAAKTQQSIHEIDMLKEMYNLKYTNNE